MMKYLVTGASGFIGFHLVQQLIKQGHDVVGIDNLNDYYDVNLKLARLAILATSPSFNFIKLDITDRQGIAKLFKQEKFNQVIHLAAQAGVRYSIINPFVYADANLIGHLSILEGCRNNQVQHLVYASSSSVYGLNSKTPFSTQDAVDHPLSLYAATKKSNELMAHSYSHLYQVPTTGLRFFTVYGPWGRPDMALFKFTKAILQGNAIDVYNHGDMSRDFTYIDDIVEGVMRIKDVPPQINDAWSLATNSAPSSSAPYKVFNIGNGNPVRLMRFIQSLEQALGKKAAINFMPMQPGDIYQTYADVEDLFSAIGYRPKTSVNSGVEQFVDWYKNYYNMS
jgi:UDP-glucuronate 4-epimerase